jgi:hypothetical protein
MEEFSVFLFTRFDEVNKKWVEDYSFYKGDYEKGFDTKDWRFCEVDGKRKLPIYMGKGSLSFPIEFPVELHNGVILK